MARRNLEFRTCLHCGTVDLRWSPQASRAWLLFRHKRNEFRATDVAAALNIVSYDGNRIAEDLVTLDLFSVRTEKNWHKYYRIVKGRKVSTAKS